MRRALLVLAVSALLAYISSPYIVRAYVHRAYPDLLVGPVEIDWWVAKITFRDVRVTRPTLTADLDKVVAYADGSISITGGLINLKEEEASSGPGSSGPTLQNVTASGLHVATRRGGYDILMSGVAFRSGEVCFTAATAGNGETETYLGPGCFATDKSWAHTSQFEALVNYGGRDFFVHASSVAYSGSHVKFDSLQVNEGVKGDLLVDGGLVYLGDGDIVADLDKVTLLHTLVDSASFSNVTVSTSDMQAFIVEIGEAVLHVFPFEKEVGGWGQCDNWLDMLPSPMPPVISNLKGKFVGSISIEVGVDPIVLDLDYRCRFDCSDPLIKDLRSKFNYSVYAKEGRLVSRVSGPGSAEWVSIHDMPPYVPEAFRIMEDGGFFQHRGISEAALFASLKANIEQGKAVRGGSTISMQLAKNLWLDRDKTVTRKAHEAFLTMALESCLDKQSIMELYVNVIEFGPDLYGIGPAAKHYFDKAVSELTPDEAFYLASILPAPKKALHPASGGMDRPRRIMKGLAKSQIISDAWVVDPDVIQDDSADWE